MKDYTWTENGFIFKRINRTKARSAYNNGLSVIACPCNLRPGRPWNPEAVLNRDICGLDFEIIENAYIFYNIRPGTGRYPAYYIPIRVVDRFTGEAPTPWTLGTVEQYNYRFLRKETKTA